MKLSEGIKSTRSWSDKNGLWLELQVTEHYLIAMLYGEPMTSANDPTSYGMGC